jgi:hypothetical protein
MICLALHRIPLIFTLGRNKFHTSPRKKSKEFGEAPVASVLVVSPYAGTSYYYLVLRMVHGATLTEFLFFVIGLVEY